MKIQEKNIILIVCSLIFIVALSYCITLGSLTKWPDEKIYIGIAERLVSNSRFTDFNLNTSAFMPPGYPFILSLTYQIDESIYLARFINVVALTATAWVLSLLVRLITPAGQIFTPILVLFYPVFTYTSGILVPQLIGSYLFVQALYWLLRYRKNLISAMACGVTFGLLILIIPSFALVLFFLIFTLLAANKLEKLYSIKYILILIIAATLVTSPWIIRSSMLFDRFVFISTNSGVNLLYGNSEYTEYNTGVIDISKYSNTNGLSEAEVDSYYRDSALNWIINNPTNAAALYIKKVLNYYNYKNKISTTSEQRTYADILMFISYYSLLFCVIIRCIYWRKYKFTWPELLLYILYFGNSFLSAIVYTRIRYRIPFDFLMIAMVSVFIAHIRNAKIKDK